METTIAVSTSEGQATELTDERREVLKAESRLKLEYMQREYWRLRNGKARYMRCPFCQPLDSRFKRRNWPGKKEICCVMFAKAFEAILDRQDEVDRAAEATRRACAMINVAQRIDDAHN